MFGHAPSTFWEQNWHRQVPECVYGTHALTQSFVIGDSLVVVASTRTDHAHVYLNRRLFGNWQISTGRPGDDTPNGTYLTIDKANPVDMVGPDYNLEVPWSVRFTWSGCFFCTTPTGRWVSRGSPT